MPTSDFPLAQPSLRSETDPVQAEGPADSHRRKPPQRVTAEEAADPLLTVDDVARRLNVSRDWVWDHSSRKSPQLPVVQMSDGALRYRASRNEAFIDEREAVRDEASRLVLARNAHPRNAYNRGFKPLA